MRIISGKYKGRTIVAPAGLPVRPTTDFAKTGLFNILQNRFDFSKCNCLDLCSGTGSISLEFASRGCLSVTAVDRDRGCISFIDQTSGKLGITTLKTIKADAIEFLKHNRQPYDIIFADPPFDSDIRLKLKEMIFSSGVLKQEGVFVLEHITGEHYDTLPGFGFDRTYGNVTFSFFFNFDESDEKATSN